MLRVYLLLLAVFFLAPSCAGFTRDDKTLQMPQAFLGNWLIDGYEFNTIIYSGGKIKTYRLSDGKLSNNAQYKVLYIYSPTKVVILLRDSQITSNSGDWFVVPDKWDEPNISILQVLPPEEGIEHYGSKLQRIEFCFTANQKQWNNFDQSKVILLKELNNSYCVTDSHPYISQSAHRY